MDSEFFGFLAVLIFFASCNNDPELSYQYNTPPSAKFKVEYYDLAFEIDPDQDQFNAAQTLTISPSVNTSTIIFDIHSDFEIDSLLLQELDGVVIPITDWAKMGDVKYERGSEIELFSRIQLKLAYNLLESKTVLLFISYHIFPSSIKHSPGNELLHFIVSTTGVRALHPINGIVPYFGGNVAAPFHMEIKHGKRQICSAPGNLVSTNDATSFTTEVFETELSFIPVFYIGPGNKVERSKDGLSVEYYLVPGQVLDEEIVDNTFKIAELYNDLFGNPGTEEYRFAFIDVGSSSITGESKGNAIYFAYRSASDYIWIEERKLEFLQLISHEVFHNWNLWYVHWQGGFYEWFTEGGASFMSAWSSERIINEEAGSSIRKEFVKAYGNNSAYNAIHTLENAQKSGAAETSLIYSYGALVWEQLRQKLGDQAFTSGLSDFFESNGFEFADYNKLIASFQSYAEFSVEQYLDQWVRNNAKIDLSIRNVTIIQQENAFKTTVELNFDTDKDYEIFTSLGFKTSASGKMEDLGIHTTKGGIQSISFISDQIPIFIQIDPYFRVPQLDLNNDSWTK